VEKLVLSELDDAALKKKKVILDDAERYER